MTGTTPVCDKCQMAGTYLRGISSESFVDYFRCPACAHVWTMPKPPRALIEWPDVDGVAKSPA